MFQDFDYWDDVGLNIPQPPNLLRLYRDFDKHAMPVAATALAKTEEENAKLVNAYDYEQFPDRDRIACMDCLEGQCDGEHQS